MTVERVDAIRWSVVVGRPTGMPRWRKALHLLYWRFFKPSFVTYTGDGREVKLLYQGGYTSNAVLNDPILYKIGDAMGTRRLWLNENLPFAFLILNDPEDSALYEWCQSCTSGRWLYVISRSAHETKFAHSVWLESQNDALLCKIRFYDRIVASYPASDDDLTDHKYGLKIKI